MWLKLLTFWWHAKEQYANIVKIICVRKLTHILMLFMYIDNTAFRPGNI